MTAKKVLVVDDDAAIREVLAACLQRLGGWQVVAVASGQEALEQIYSVQPDVILLDWMMPKMDGLTFLEVLNSKLPSCAVPVVVLTASSYLDKAKSLTKLGVVLTISKPFDPIDLVEHIAQILEW